MNVYCPELAAQRAVEVCLYKCPMRKKAKCPEYLKYYEAILSYPIEKIYLERYGEPIIVLPNAMRKRRKRRTKLEMEVARAATKWEGD